MVVAGDSVLSGEIRGGARSTFIVHMIKNCFAGALTIADLGSRGRLNLELPSRQQPRHHVEGGICDRDFRFRRMQ